MRAERTNFPGAWQVRRAETALARLRGVVHGPHVPLALRLTFWLSSLCALAAAGTYVATFFGRALYPVLLLLPGLLVVWPLVLWQWRRVPRRNLTSQVFGDVPRWMKWSIAALLIFAFANYFAGNALNDGGAPRRRSDGTFVLVRGKETIRQLELPEFRRAEAIELRVVAGFFLTTYALAALLAEACWIKNGPAMADARID